VVIGRSGRHFLVEHDVVEEAVLGDDGAHRHVGGGRRRVA
jgi:hypothetical protein